jgi:hypothetical protein
MRITRTWPHWVWLLILGCAPIPTRPPPPVARSSIIRTQPLEPPKPGPRDLRQVVFGHYHGCALYYDGTVSCWHAHQWGAGDGQPSDPIQVAGMPPMRWIELGTYAACGLTMDGDVYCWSAPRTEKPEGPVPTGPIRMNLRNVLQLEMADYYACALMANGEMGCWNCTLVGGMEGSFGEPSRASKPEVKRFFIGGESNLMCRIGDQKATCGVGNDVPLKMPASDALQIGIGEDQGCVRGPLGVRCFDSRQPTAPPQFRGATRPTELPLVPGTQAATYLSVGARHSCIQSKDGRILCWGENSNGEVDPKSLVTTLDNPAQVAHFPPDWRLTCHDSVTCVNSPSAEYHCWGRCSQLPPLPKLECQGVTPGLLPRDELVQ